MGSSNPTIGNNLTTPSNVETNGVNLMQSSNLLRVTNGIRNQLIARNFYSANKVYPTSTSDNLQNITNAINGIVSIIAPFKSYDLSNTVYGRLIVNHTPLTDIGLAMLGNQFMLNVGSIIAKNTLPTMNLSLTNIVNSVKGKSSLFTKNINYQITKKSGISSFQQFLDATVFYNFNQDNPFTPTSTEADYIQNTGSGQLKFFYTALNQNIYKQGFSSSYVDKVLTEYSNIAQVPLTYRNTIIGTATNPLNKYKIYFNFINSPYSQFPNTNTNEINNANSAAVISMNANNLYNSSNDTQEYAPNISFVEQNFGVSKKSDIPKFGFPISQVHNDWVGTSSAAESDSTKDNIVWGRDGIAQSINNEIGDLRGNTEIIDTAMSGAHSDLAVDFNVYSGILDYTKNLVNASGGALVDITRKAFVDKNQNVIGFNGSNLWVANNSQYAQKSGTADYTGIRQHSALDQYDRFAKAIRFNGNSVYLGNQNSVINNSVLPNIFPTINSDGTANNKNLMFSLENLAVRVIGNTTTIDNGIIDDEYGTEIPASEVGPFNGRIMWFPPYNIEVNETSNAKWESTVMVGRNEPMYSYQYSERSATLNFTLLVDYPQVLKNAIYQGQDKNRAIAEFFAFGGDPYTPPPLISNANQKIQQNNAQINIITGPTGIQGPNIKLPASIKVYFPNNMPSANQVDNIIDDMYLEYNYEIITGNIEGNGNTARGGYNGDIYVITGMTGNSTLNNLRLATSLLPSDFSQYNQVGPNEDGTSCPLNDALKLVFADQNNTNYYEISIEGHTTTLNDNNPKNPTYNLDLGARRAIAAEYLVKQRILALFGKTASKYGINITKTSTASAGSKQANGTPAAIETAGAIQERYAKITFVARKDVPMTLIQPKSFNGFNINTNDANAIDQLKRDNAALTKTIVSQNSNSASQNVYKQRSTATQNSAGDSGDGAILKGFDSISGNYYYPVFHSQTPEDFHRRLTFLQQCLRQGSAKRNNNTTNDQYGTLRARNSIFGRQPICILRIGDFFYTKVIIENLNIDYTDTTWDMNPEGFGMQPMIAKVTLQMKLIGGESLTGPIDALQNAITFNYYANSNYTNLGMYKTPANVAEKQDTYIQGILAKERDTLQKEYTANQATQKQNAINIMNTLINIPINP